MAEIHNHNNTVYWHVVDCKTIHSDSSPYVLSPNLGCPCATESDKLSHRRWTSGPGLSFQQTSCFHLFSVSSAQLPWEYAWVNFLDDESDLIWSPPLNPNKSQPVSRSLTCSWPQKYDRAHPRKQKIYLVVPHLNYSSAWLWAN